MQHWTPEQQKAHRQEWIKALRSGQYKQGYRQLRSKIGYCCLGVACDVAIKSGAFPTLKWTEEIAGIGYEVVNEHGDKAFGLPPIEIQHYFGICNRAGLFEPSTPTDHINNLARMNDDGGATFDDIANLIEIEPPGLVRASPVSD